MNFKTLAINYPDFKISDFQPIQLGGRSWCEERQLLPLHDIYTHRTTSSFLSKGTSNKKCKETIIYAIPGHVSFSLKISVEIVVTRFPKNKSRIFGMQLPSRYPLCPTAGKALVVTLKNRSKVRIYPKTVGTIMCIFWDF
jgi:hypothetical protein